MMGRKKRRRKSYDSSHKIVGYVLCILFLHKVLLFCLDKLNFSLENFGSFPKQVYLSMDKWSRGGYI